MPQNGISIGRDIALNVVTSKGPISLGIVTGFKSKQDTTESRVKGIDGISRHLRFFDGWSGSFDVERTGATVDNYFTQLEADYYAGLNEGPVTITETITEPDGSLSQFRHTGVYLRLEDNGSYSGDSSVKQSIGFKSSRKLKLV